MSGSARAPGVRALARAQMTTEILDVARDQLALRGAGGLSLRAVAREVGMVSSAIYRYFDSRDALLTALIIDAYNSLGETVERAEAAVDRDDLAGRWRAVALSVRDWASAYPHLYALVYGSPVPGYAAPRDTVGPATRATAVLTGILADQAQRERSSQSRAAFLVQGQTMPHSAEVAIAPLRLFIGQDASSELAVRALMAWTGIFGAISFELFGQLHTVIEPAGRGEVYAVEVDRMATLLGLSEA